MFEGGYQRLLPVRRPKPGSWLGVIGSSLKEDKTKPARQRHTAKRILDAAGKFTTRA